MNKLMKIVAIILGILIIVVGVTGLMKSSPSTGGSFNPVKVDFAQGISVGGVDVISSTRALTALNPVTTLTSDTTITTAASGTTYNIGTAGVDVTLPAPTTSAGVNYKFVVSANYATTAMTIIAGTADTIEGSLVVAGAIVACDAADLVSISATNEDIGDTITLYSNGTNWIIEHSNAFAASVFTCSG